RMMLTAVAMLALTSLVRADDELPIPADDYVYCTVCHGVQLMGNPIIRAPRLSGMDSWYVENQLRAFKKGWRGKHERDVVGMEMRTMAAALTEEQIKEVSAFVATTRSDHPPETINGDADRGKAHYSTCAACHGVNGEGNIALGSPALTGQNDWYLVRQLQHFRDGTRGGQPGDTYGMQMRASAGLLSDDEAILDVVKYISTL
ncbi:MAG: c-type cytochrome, partial [Proteobacteria bacterium]|nr:c-type cytochrome [Pseudomonadota bacterium]